MLSLKTTIASWISKPWFGKLIFWINGNKITRNGASYVLDSPLINNRVKALIFWNLYEKAEIRFVQKYLSGKYPVIEFGGSIGIVSSVISKKIGQQQLLIVEANIGLISVLETQLRINKFEEFEIIHAGVGNGRELFFITGNDNTVGKVSTHSESLVDQIPMITLRSLLLGKNISDYSLVSDIEGAELCFIFDDPSSLKNCKELIIELHDATWNGKLISISEQIQQLESIGFRIIARHGPVIFAVQ